MNMSADALKRYLHAESRKVTAALDQYLPGDSGIMTRAMRYSLLAGGKRLRPILVLEAARVCGTRYVERLMPAACALEYIHTYSLIHDDLPAMDNDDLRRGKPTSHKKFGEAAAILAGDALLTEAFRLMAGCSAKGIAPGRPLRAVAIMAEAAGYRGMIAGQVKDTLEQEKWKTKNKAAARRTLDEIHENKTGALIRASLKIGAVLSGASEVSCAALDRYGRDIGLAFQIADDILDIIGDKKLLGKKGSDRENQKLTFPALYGIDESRRRAESLVASAKKNLVRFGDRAHVLKALADYIIERQS